MSWTKAATVTVCKECGDDIWPADVIYVTRDLEPRFPGPPRIRREMLCEDCGKLYLESQELGSSDAS